MTNEQNTPAEDNHGTNKEEVRPSLSRNSQIVSIADYDLTEFNDIPELVASAEAVRRKKLKRQQSSKINTKILQLCPRTFFLLKYVILPIILMSLVCLLFGCFVAYAESEGFYGNSKASNFGLSSKGEKASNDDTLRVAYETYLASMVDESNAMSSYVSAECLDRYMNLSLVNDPNAFLNVTLSDFRQYIALCSNSDTTNNTTIPKSEDFPTFFQSMMSQNPPPLFFEVDWTYCSNSKSYGKNEFSNHIRYSADQFHQSYEELYDKYTLLELIVEDASSRALAEASGMSRCGPRFVTGALYWATLMTTVGYGNTIVASHISRILSYSFGFFSILIFIMKTGQSGKVLMAIFDDLAVEHKLIYLSKGTTSSIFWLVNLVCVIILIGVFAFGIVADQTSVEIAESMFPFSEYIWFSYITVTTVGFGDYSISPVNSNPMTIMVFIFVVLLGHSIFVACMLKMFNLFSAYTIFSGDEAYIVLRRLRALNQSNAFETGRNFASHLENETEGKCDDDEC